MKVATHWCEVGRNKRRYNENPRHISFYNWGYDECPICAKVLKVVWNAGVYNTPQVSSIEEVEE